MNTKPTAKERLHLARIKALPCACCGAPPVSEAHHVKQASAYHCIPLCESCHRGPLLGWHGQRRAWTLRKTDEVDAMARTIAMLVGDLKV